MALETPKRREREEVEVLSPHKPDKGEDPCRAKRRIDAWLLKNQSQIRAAEQILGARWADPLLFDEHMALCDKVLSVMKQVLGFGNLGSEAAASKTLLILGESGSGKTQAVDWCLNKLKQEQSHVVTLRARGDYYASNVECLRHLASQISAQLLSAPKPATSFETSMEWFRCIVKESFSRDSAVVIVLDRFEAFCYARQTLLYNLFNMAQDLSVRLCIVGISEQFDVTNKLEKRILSRFSMEYVCAFLPHSLHSLLQLLECKLHITDAAPGLDARFVEEFNAKVSEALALRLPGWEQRMELGRKPTWFLWRCLPVASFLRSALSGTADADMDPPSKRARLAGDDLSTRYASLLTGLVECEHLILLTLFRQRERAAKEERSLSTVLHELRQLVDKDKGVLAGHTEATFTAAFSRLVEIKLIRFGLKGSEEPPKMYRPCESTVDDFYRAWVADLSKKELEQNPLRRLPEPVRLWALRSK